MGANMTGETMIIRYADGRTVSSAYNASPSATGATALPLAPQ
jgi:hypothetical protein